MNQSDETMSIFDDSIPKMPPTIKLVVSVRYK